MILQFVRAKDPGETFDIPFDFSPALSSDEALIGGTLTVTAREWDPLLLVDGALVPSLLTGTPSVGDAIAVQFVTAGTAGKTYKVTATAQTTRGQLLVVSAVFAVRVK